MQFFDDQLVATTQGRLADLGWYKGKVDGDEGPMTENALARFKAAHGMRERPYPGPLTMATLWGSAAKVAPAPVAMSCEPSWLAEARSLLGTREVRGAGNSATIMKWARDLDQWYTGDDVPWCGLFVAHCMSVGAPDEPQDFNRLGARAWLEFGEDCGAKMGAVAVFWRTHKTRSWNGHVAILTGESDTAYRVIGGNQSDNVTETWIAKSRILGFRAPVGWSGSKAPTASTGQLSTNEA
jgi:uncharacterized protein (TIGR02594 family)